MKKVFQKSVLTLRVISIIGTVAHANDVVPETITKVVVTESGSEQNVADAPASISVITAEELQKKAYTDVTDAIKNIPGISVAGGGNNQDILLRGMGQAIQNI